MSFKDIYGENNDATGCHVMSVSNEDELPFVGKLVGYYQCHSNLFPLVKDINGVELVCMGVVIPYTPEFYKFLCELPYKRRWEIVSDFSMLNQTIKKRQG